MAAKILRVERARDFVSDSADESTHGSGRLNGTDRFIVTVDLESDGRRIVTISVREADHAGIEAEYLAGTATTLIEAAIDADVAGLVEGTDVVADALTATQKANLITKTVAWV